MSKGLLLSGGMDSISIAYWIKPNYAFTVNYGQRSAAAEMQASQAVCKSLGLTHIPITVDCSSLGSGDLSEQNSINVSPSTEWWPFRNQMLITLVAMKAISMGIDELIVGSVKNDGFHADGKPEFYKYINELMLFQEGNIKISAPAVDYTTVDLIKVSNVPKDILSWAHSCHKSNYPCGSCRGCDKYVHTMQLLNYA